MLRMTLAGAATVIVLLCCLPVAGQVVTGSAVGSIADSTGSVIPGAAVSLVSEATGAVRKASTDQAGAFTFNAMPPGAYTLTAEHAGFKTFEKTSIVLMANGRLSLGEIRLEVGAVGESVTVTAEGETVQTASGDRSDVITHDQVSNLTAINRDFATLASLLPGVVENPGEETQGFTSSSTFNVQGGRSTSNSVTIDGMPVTQPNGSATGTFMSMDSVASVKLMVSSYQAEFGRKPGAAIQAITKSGGRQFHGAAYWYTRHEQFNANSFFNNRGGVPEGPYRYTTAGFNVGGPLYIPGLFNRQRRRLFFFFSSEQLREARPQAIREVTTPTEAERRGDFSDSRDLNGTLIPVRDPVNGAQPFPGNAIPANRIDSSGQNYLKLLPLPNVSDLAVSARRYNYQVQESLRIPKNSETLRVDFPLDDRTTLYSRFNYWNEKSRGFAVGAGNSNWGWLPSSYKSTSKSVSISASRILNPSLILEASMSALHWTETGAPLKQEDVDRLNRAKAGVNIPQLHPENNPLNLVPNATFGGVNSAISTNIESRFPLWGTNVEFAWTANLTKTHGAHVMKAGFWAESWEVDKISAAGISFNGSINFGRNATNPYDSNHPFANALLGNFASYTESTSRPRLYERFTAVEWFAQDNWKATRRLTLDFGLRFAWSQPYHNTEGIEAGFLPDRYDPARQVTLIRPGRSGNARLGVNPLTGEFSPAATIGAIARGAGDPFNGTVDRRKEPGYPQGLLKNTPLRLAPRFGFAYDPFGRGKTAIRGGIGFFYEVSERLNYTPSPPLKLDPVIYNGNIANIRGLEEVNFPTNTQGYDPRRPLGRVMNYSIGIQQYAGFGTVVDVSYVAALSRHLMQRRDLNSIPFGANFLPSSLDATTNGQPLPASFLRPYLGYNDILYYAYDGSANYHSLQVAANRRFSRGVQFGVAWTWSKAMDYADSDTAEVSMLVNRRVWNYGRAGFDRTHILKLNWIWDVPKASRAWDHVVARKVLDGWQVSGIASFVSGAPSGISLGFGYTVDITGSPTDGARVVVLQKPTIPKSERTFSHNFNTAAFAAPALGTYGNAAKDLIRGPGMNNWNISLFKNTPLGSDKWKLQFRAEAYNAFNHTQFRGLDTNARFDQQGRQTNARFSEFTAAYPSRRVQLALRLTF